MKKNIYLWLPLICVVLMISSCMDNLSSNGEQYKNQVSLVAVVDQSTGVVPIYMRYKNDSIVNYQLPVEVSGSTINRQNLTVHVALDPDSLNQLNVARFANNTQLYYTQLEATRYSMPLEVNIPAGQNQALLNIGFDLDTLNMVDKWVLPLTVVQDDSYQVNPYRNYRKALLRIFPFNDFSGTYSATTLQIFLVGDNSGNSISQATKTLYVKDENTCFMYAGQRDETYTDRGNYKIYVHLDPNSPVVQLSADNPSMNFSLAGSTPMTYTIVEQMDALQAYLKHQYITIYNIDYFYSDYTSVPGYTIDYEVKGTLTLDREINTQIPDQDQSIIWN